MSRAVPALILAVVSLFGLYAGGPAYSAASVLHGATWEPGPLAPNNLVIIRGAELSFEKGEASPDLLRFGPLPTLIPTTGVRVSIGEVLAVLLSVSPEEIVAIVPPILRPGKVKLYVLRNSLKGPDVELEIRQTAPAFFLSDAGHILARRNDEEYAFLSEEKPARPGDSIILYASGLGQTYPPLDITEPPREDRPLAIEPGLKILWNGSELPPNAIEYAGLLPGFPGFYQIRLQAPANSPDEPEVRLVMGDVVTPPGQRLWLRRPPM